MAWIWQEIRTGRWLTPQRLRGYAFILLVTYGVTAVLWIGLSHGFIDRNGKPIGPDFSNVYAAGKLVLAGKASVAYDWAREHAVEIATFGGRPVPFFGWHYPPLFLMIAALLAVLPYIWALALWMAVTLAAYLVTIRAILPRPQTILVALAFPAVFINLCNGQNGFLSAALLGGALLLLDWHPIVAGVLIGLMAYKPQFGVLIPLVLIATGRWTVIAAAAGTVLVACAATFALFGVKVWTAFAASTALTRHVVLEHGATGWQKIQSLFSAVRMWDGSIDAAYAAQAALALAVAVALVWLWRSEAAYELKAAALAVGALIVTPYLLDYDLMLLAVSIAFYARHALNHGFRDFEISLVAFVWIAPLLARALAHATSIPLGLIAQLVLLIMMLDRARCEVAPPRRRESLAQA